MKRILIQIGVSALLAGCTVNNFHITHYSPSESYWLSTYEPITTTETTLVENHSRPAEVKPEVKIVKKEIKPDIKLPPKSPTPTPVPVEATPVASATNGPVARIRPECGPYIPLPIPKPIRIDLAELEAANTSQEINAIALKNVKDLHLQYADFFARREKNYADYVRRCVVKAER